MKRDIFHPALKTAFCVVVFWAVTVTQLFARQSAVAPLGGRFARPAPFLALGGSGGASLKENLSYIINPALIGFQSRSKGGIFYSIRKNRQTGGLSFLDHHTKIPLALTWRRRWSRSFMDSDGQSLKAALGFRLTSWLSFGLKAQREWRPLAWNGGLGLAVRLQEGIGLALYGDPVFKEKKQDRRNMSLAFYYNWREVFSFQGDLSVSTKKKWIARGGLESFFQKFFSLRLGGVWRQNTRPLSFSGGLAFQNQRFVLEYGLEKDKGAFRHAGVFLLRF